MGCCIIICLSCRRSNSLYTPSKTCRYLSLVLDRRFRFSAWAWEVEHEPVFRSRPRVHHLKISLWRLRSLFGTLESCCWYSAILVSS